MSELFARTFFITLGVALFALACVQPRHRELAPRDIVGSAFVGLLAGILITFAFLA